MSLLRERQGRASGIPRCARDDKEVLLVILRVSTVVIKQLLRTREQLLHHFPEGLKPGSGDSKATAYRRRSQRVLKISFDSSFAV